MNVPLRNPWTQERFLAWAERQDAPYEFDGVQPVSMTGGSKRHDQISTNIHIALRPRLRGGPCSHHGPNLGLQTIGMRIRYPDALITCTPFPGTAKLAPNAVVVFEVVSPSSFELDGVQKLREYQAVPSILRYLVVESSGPGLQVFSRQHGDLPWTACGLTKDEKLAIPEVGIEIPVSEFYEGVDFEEDATDETA